jgi:copper chaperone CopZ
VCAHAVRVALKGVNGVDSVDVSLNKGLATVTLKPGNTVTIEQLQHAITKNGFTTKQSTVVVTGTLLLDDHKETLRVSGSNELFNLVPENHEQANTTEIKRLSGRTVTVEGIIPETSKGKKPDTIDFRTIVGA